MARSGLIGGLLLAGCASASAQDMPHVSFNCAKVGTVVEKTICGSSDLSMKDGVVSALYRDALARHPGDQATLRTGQRAFLRERDACPSKVPASKLAGCIDDAYLGRADQLAGPSGGNVNVAPIARGNED